MFHQLEAFKFNMKRTKIKQIISNTQWGLTFKTFKKRRDKINYLTNIKIIGIKNIIFSEMHFITNHPSFLRQSF